MGALRFREIRYFSQRRIFIAMAESSADRPEAGEYLPYYGKYISLVPSGDILATLVQQLGETLALLRSLSESQADSRYAPGKWSIKEVVGHIIDTERILAYRALRFARNDQTPLPGFEPDGYVRHAEVGGCKLDDLVNEFELVRRANLCFFRRLDGAAWRRRGIASDGEISVRALAYTIAGHEKHHMQIVREKYL
jgi:hypothetical protein